MINGYSFSPRSEFTNSRVPHSSPSPALSHKAGILGFIIPTAFTSYVTLGKSFKLTLFSGWKIPWSFEEALERDRSASDQV